MQLNRFWSSVWSVGSYLLGVGLLQVVIGMAATLFGLVPMTFAGAWILPWVGAVVPIVGTFYYMNWRWGWTAEHIGLTRRPAAAGRALLGLVLGVGAALLSHLLSAAFAGAEISLIPRVHAMPVGSLMPLAVAIVSAFAIELVYRGAVISRYQADLAPREVLAAGTLTPFFWLFVQALLARVLFLPTPTTGISGATSAAMTVALALLFIRTDSVWLTAGLRIGMLVAPLVLLLPMTDAGGLAVWGVAAVILLALEWFRQERMPRRVQPGGGPQRFFRGGRTVRGPWGPH